MGGSRGTRRSSYRLAPGVVEQVRRIKAVWGLESDSDAVRWAIQRGVEATDLALAQLADVPVVPVKPGVQPVHFDPSTKSHDKTEVPTKKHTYSSFDPQSWRDP